MPIEDTGTVEETPTTTDIIEEEALDQGHENTKEGLGKKDHTRNQTEGVIVVEGEVGVDRKEKSIGKWLKENHPDQNPSKEKSPSRFHNIQDTLDPNQDHNQDHKKRGKVKVVQDLIMALSTNRIILRKEKWIIDENRWNEHLQPSDTQLMIKICSLKLMNLRKLLKRF